MIRNEMRILGDNDENIRPFAKKIPVDNADELNVTLGIIVVFVNVEVMRLK
jgi:hypothetical protein